MRALGWMAVVAATCSWSATATAGEGAAQTVVRDHRESTEVIVRDHRKPVIVRDHRTSDDPVIRDHRTPPVVTVPKTTDKPAETKTDTGKSSDGVVVESTPPVIIRDHRTTTESLPGGVKVTTTRRPARRPSQPTILLPNFPFKIRL